MHDWQWKSLTEAVARVEQYGIRGFIEAAAGNPVPVILEVARTLNADLVVLGGGHETNRGVTQKRADPSHARIYAISNATPSS
ncbi:MAG: universal stress protein [Actinobacteria bacterium]|nr:universal stress protein [Actinomycetota bacterium]